MRVVGTAVVAEPRGTCQEASSVKNTRWSPFRSFSSRHQAQSLSWDPQVVKQAIKYTVRGCELVQLLPSLLLPPSLEGSDVICFPVSLRLLGCRLVHHQLCGGCRCTRDTQRIRQSWYVPYATVPLTAFWRSLSQPYIIMIR